MKASERARAIGQVHLSDALSQVRMGSREEIEVQEMLKSHIALDMEDRYVIHFETLANYFFLGIWEAADDSEFVLSGNGFGLWEGLIDGYPGLIGYTL